jgi:hypothetical protein
MTVQSILETLLAPDVKLDRLKRGGTPQSRGCSESTLGKLAKSSAD